MLTSLGVLDGASRREPRSFFSGIRATVVAGLIAMFMLPLAARATDVPMTLEGGISATLNMPDSTEPVSAVLLLSACAGSKPQQTASPLPSAPADRKSVV